jgi:hypothetical protein
MKSITIVFSVLLLCSFVGTSFAQEFVPFPSTDKTLPEVSLQLVLRNSNGQLITYIEPTLAYIPSVPNTHKYLDTVGDKTIITRDGQNFEQIEYTQTSVFSTSEQFATFGMVYNGDFVYLMRHDAYLSHPGDVLTVHWHIVRTLDR